jgi:DNA-directed RNA polymerase specialized sigma24 family protein
MIRDEVGGVDASLPLEFNGIDVSLPLAFGAFCMLHGAHYQAYAQYRLGDATAAQHAVRCALGGLLVVWPAALTSEPAAVGWRILRRQMAVSLRLHTGTCPDTVHRLVPAPAADAAVLHHGLGLSADGIADLMGCTPEHALYWLATFERHLAQQTEGELRAAVDDMRAGRSVHGALPS